MKANAQNRNLRSELFGKSPRQTFWTKNWYYLYFILAAFDVLAIGISLLSSHNNLNNYDQAVDYTDNQIKVLSLASEVSQWAQRVDAPGNDIFDSKDPARERLRLITAKAEYDRRIAELQSFNAEVARSLRSPASLAADAQHFEEIHRSMSLMNDVANQIFDFFERHDSTRAAALMAEMDRRNAELNRAIESFRKFKMEQISTALYAHRNGLNLSKEREIYFSVLILLSVLGITLFGKRLSGFMKNVLNSAQKNSSILNAVSDAAIVAFTDTCGRITEVNANFCKISGYSREELIGQDHRIVNSGAHSKDFFSKLWKTIQSGQAWSGDIENRSKTGEPYFVRTVITPIKDAQGEIEQYMTVRFDVTESKKLEATLSESQKIAKLGSWKYDLKTGGQTWTSEHYRIFEIEEPQPQELLHQLYRERIHPEDRAELDRITHRALNLGEDFVYNHRVYLDNGARIKHVRGIGKVTRDPSGEPISISGTCQDLTALVTLQEQNQFILKAMGIGIWKYNPLSQDLQWDQSLYDLYEINPRDFSGDYQAWESCLSPEVKLGAIEELQKALRGEKDFNTTFEIVTRNGVRKHIGGKGIVIRNDKGEATEMYGINWDKTKEVLAERKLNDALTYLQTVFDFVPGPVYSKRPDGKYIFVNQRFREVVPLPSRDITTLTDLDIFSREMAEVLMNNDRSIAQTRKEQHCQETVQHRDGTNRIYDSYKFPVLNANGDLVSITGMSFDMTETHKLREQLEIERLKATHNAKLASLGEMSAGIAHEINNPLAIISGTMGLLTKFANQPERLAAKIETMQKSCERISRIVHGLKKFSRSGDKSDYQNFELSSLVKEALVLTEAKSKRYSTPITFEGDSQACVHGNEVEIEQVVVNLINNAIDAVKEASEKWVKIFLSEDTEALVLRITDAGQGVPESIRAKIFDPFFTTKKIGEGTGLGLSISKGILDEHRATIAVVADAPHTCFEIRFPKVSAPSGEVKNAA